jgi:hypothetical protein
MDTAALAGADSTGSATKLAAASPYRKSRRESDASFDSISGGRKKGKGWLHTAWQRHPVFADFNTLSALAFQIRSPLAELQLAS